MWQRCSNASLISQYCAFSPQPDHTGVSNAQLVKEGVPLAKKYNDRSVAEQNSLDLSWSILMQPDYRDLRAYLFQTQEDLVRFRQLVVNAVMSTDIVSFSPCIRWIVRMPRVVSHPQPSDLS